MSTFLAIECSGKMGSVALRHNGQDCLLATSRPKRHSQHILRLTVRLLEVADLDVHQLDAIVFGKGPGSFTGLRVAAATAMGLAIGADLPVIAVSTMAALAQAHAIGHSKIAVAMDARLGELYHGLYQVKDNIATAVTEDAILKPHDMPLLQTREWFGAGDGWLLTGMDNNGLYDSDHSRLPTALDLLPQAGNAPYLDAAQALPSYLRQNVAQKPKLSHVK
ncbi:MAG: tRNA (adenosine(37)-N6)-threonylcarbamoyltransferase complex dimerization subunit type 1 TsaB [Candidatus Porifericomitaceae bacterium WSBS_2022_MAG_OTU9]